MKLPSLDELQLLRKGLRKRKLPRVFDGLWCSEPGIGGMKVTADGSNFHVEWVSFSDGVKSELKHADWNRLCTDPNLELQRFEIGHVVSEIFQIQGQRISGSIGHPVEAYKEAQPYMQVAEEWKHWGTVKARHMLGLPPDLPCADQQRGAL